MKKGKVSQSVLKRSVLKQLHTKSENVITSAGVGIDYGAFRTGNTEGSCSQAGVVTATETSALPYAHQALRVVTAAANNVAVSGAVPTGITVSITASTLSQEAEIRELMRDIDEVCASMNLAVLGGSTTVSSFVKQIVLTVTAFGILAESSDMDEEKKCPEAINRKQTEKSVYPGLNAAGIKPGMDIILTKYIALDGTALLAEEKEEELRTRFAQPFLDRAKAYGGKRSILSEAAVAAKSGAAALHDVSEGGIFGALWEMAECSGVGLEIDLKKIPIRQETVEICEFFDVNPYKLLSAGCLLIAAEDGNVILRELEKAGIPAKVIGTATDSNDRILYNEEERRFLETVQMDEIYKVLEG